MQPTTTATRPLVSVSDLVLFDPDDWTHIVDPGNIDRALCGEDVTNAEWSDNGRTCPDCARIEHL